MENIGFVFAQLVQIGLALYAWRKLEPFPGMTPRDTNARNAVMAFGVIPCPGMGAFMQLLWIGLYKGHEAFARRTHGRAAATLVTSFDAPRPGPAGPPATGNPFDGASVPRQADPATPPQPRPAPANNPFD